jgi:hypothetical protein
LQGPALWRALLALGIPADQIRRIAAGERFVVSYDADG